MITVQDIQNSLQISQTEVQMAIYSGALPKCTTVKEDGKMVIPGWDDDHISPFLKVFSERIKRKKAYKDKHNDTIVCGLLTFPTHQR